MQTATSLYVRTGTSLRKPNSTISCTKYHKFRVLTQTWPGARKGFREGGLEEANKRERERALARVSERVTEWQRETERKERESKREKERELFSISNNYNQVIIEKFNQCLINWLFLPKFRAIVYCSRNDSIEYGEKIYTELKNMTRNYWVFQKHTFILRQLQTPDLCQNPQLAGKNYS